MTISLVLADDHPLVLDGLESLVAKHADLRVLARCPDGQSALQAVQQHRPDILVLDLRMPRLDGLSVLRRMKELELPTRVVVLTAALDDDDLIEAVRLGVRGVVLKEMAPQMLIQCIRRVSEGGQWLERASMASAMDKLVRREAGEREAGAILTPRELEVVRSVAQGLRNKEIARQLDINEGTVKIHLHRVYEKLGIDGRLALAVYARKKGLV